MPRTLVVLERRLLPRVLGRARQTEAIVQRLGQRFRFMPDTAERLSASMIEIPFPPRKSITEARVEVRGVLEAINPHWRRHLHMTNEPSRH
jgi:hypothetical protein